MKRWQIIVLSICIVMILSGVLVTILNRGRLFINIENQTTQELVLISIREQEFNITITPGDSCKVEYDIKSDGGVGIKLQHGNAVVSKELVEYVEPAYYGTSKVIITETLENELEIEVKSRVDF